ncbi:MAG: YbaK/EbsC family protein, partial [Anaerolineales bacterium]
PTVESAAQAVGAHPDQIVKSVLFLIRGEPLLAIAYGTTRIDRRNIATRYGVGRKRVKLAGAETVLQITGYPVGAVPPFGHPQPIPTLLDPGILEHEQVYAGGGSGSALVRLVPKDILRITNAEIVPLSEGSPKKGGGGGCAAPTPFFRAKYCIMSQFS